MRLDAAIIKNQIDNLLILYPELLEDEVLRADMVEGSTDLVVFLRRIEVCRQEAMAMSEALGSVIDALHSRMGRFERRDRGIRNLMFMMLQAANQKRIELPEATLSIRLGVPKVIVVDEAAIPDEFCRIKREPDRKKIKEALAQFQAVPGATLSNAEDTISIRVK